MCHALYTQENIVRNWARFVPTGLTNMRGDKKKGPVRYEGNRIVQIADA